MFFLVPFPFFEHVRVVIKPEKISLHRVPFFRICAFPAVELLFFLRIDGRVYRSLAEILLVDVCEVKNAPLEMRPARRRKEFLLESIPVHAAEERMLKNSCFFADDAFESGGGSGGEILSTVEELLGRSGCRWREIARSVECVGKRGGR